jgi:2-phospho-L-lactate transferase/gluconeogenesis factor (CofD/UPF0052 family)
LYRDFLDTFVLDTQDTGQRERLEQLGLSVIVTDTIMSDVEKSEALARAIIDYTHRKSLKELRKRNE